MNKDRDFFKMFSIFFFISIFVLFFANSAILIYLSNSNLSSVITELYTQKAEQISQMLDDSLINPLSGLVFNQLVSFQSSSMMNFLIYDKNKQFAGDLSREIDMQIVRNKWLKSIIVYREDGQIITDYVTQRRIKEAVQATLLNGTIDYIAKKNYSSGWIAQRAGNNEAERSLMYFLKFPMTNPSRNRGVIIYLINTSFFVNEITKFINPKEESVIIEDENSQILFSCGKIEIPSWINATRSEKLVNRGPWQIIWQPLHNQNISLALVVSSLSLQKNLLYYQKLTLTLTFLFIVAFGIYLSFITARIQNPLTKILDILRNMIHNNDKTIGVKSLISTTNRVIDESRSLIAHRFIVNLLTEGMERNEFVQICELIGIKSCKNPFYILLVELDPSFLRDLNWEEREHKENNLQKNWDSLLTDKKAISIRYPAGNLVCLFFTIPGQNLPLEIFLTFALKTHTNIAYSLPLMDTVELPKTYDLLVDALDNRLFHGYGNIFPQEGSYSSSGSAFSIEPLKGLLMEGHYKDFEIYFSKEIKKLEANGTPPVIIRDYFILIAELIDEVYQKKARIRDNMELSYLTMREEVKQLSCLSGFDEWLGNKIEVLTKSLQCTKEENHKDLIEQIQKYILLSLDKNITQKMIAEQFGISSGFLSRLFREYSTAGFSSYLKECKLKEAAKMIKEKKGISISGLAHDLGYSSSVYFSRQFYKQFGLLPHEYAKQNNEISK